METSLRYGKDSTALKLHAKQKFPVVGNTLLQLNGELNTKIGAPSYFSALIRHFFPTASEGAAELSWSILNFQKEQDVLLKVGYDILHKIPYVQIRENNWTFNTDINGRWNVRYDL